MNVVKIKDIKTVLNRDVVLEEFYREVDENLSNRIWKRIKKTKKYTG